MRKLILLTGLLISCNISSPPPPTLQHIPFPKVNNIKVAASPCPPGMNLIEGSFCKNPRQVCQKWLDPEKSIVRRCAQYQTTQCTSSKETKLFCMDVEEYTQIPSTKPLTNLSWTDATKICQAEGKRLCDEKEWTAACEGPQALPYPYGYQRQSSWCNIDKLDLLNHKGEFIDQLQDISQNPKCYSPFGIHNMTGNADEMVNCSHGEYPFRSCEMGGWWGPVRNRCRATTYGHDEFFKEIQIGFRCCAEANKR